MNLLNLILLFAALTNSALAGFVFWRRHTRPHHFVFAFSALAISCWTTTVFAISAVDSEAVLTVLGRVAFAFSAVIAFTYLMFSWVFPEQYHIRTRRRTVVMMAVLTVAMVALCASPWVQPAVTIGLEGKQPVLGPLHPVYMLFMLVVSAWGTVNFLLCLGGAPPGKGRMQVKYCMLGFGLTWLQAFIVYFVMPYTSSGMEWWVVGGASPLIWTSLTFYAVFRHRLMDIGLAARNVLIHGILGAILAVFVYMPFLLRQHLVTGTSIVTDVLLVVMAATALALLMPRLQRGVTTFVDHTLFRGRYDMETALVRFSDRLISTYGRDNIARMAARDIPIILQADGASVYLPREGQPDFVLSAWSGNEDFDRPETLSRDHPILATVLERQSHLVQEDVAYQAFPIEGGKAILEAFASLRPSVVFPFICQGRFLGVMFVGEKHKDNVFTREDIDLLGALSSQVAFALDNMRLYEQVLESKRYYETILRHMLRGVLTVDSQLDVVTLNDTGAGMFGVEEEAWVGKGVSELAPGFADLLRQTLDAGADQPRLEISEEVDDETVPFECETSILRDARNRVTGALLVFQDLTEQKGFEQQVRRMDRLASVGTLAAGIAHEIKNPMVSIHTFAQLLPSRYEDAEFREGFGEVVRGEIGRINRLVESLLDFSRPRPQQTGQVDIHRLFDRALALLENQINKQEIQVDRDFDDDFPPIVGDGEQLYQVILNLMQNSIHAMNGNVRKISLLTRGDASERTNGSEEMVQFKVSDTGSGIPEDAVARIFDPFYSTKPTGSGLGLSICHGIVKDHGGTIDVASQPNAGTTFTICLPKQGHKSATTTDDEET